MIREKINPINERRNIILEKNKIAIRIINPEITEFCKIKYPRFNRNRLTSSGRKDKYVAD